MPPLDSCAQFDASRYHVQVLFVDDDGVRARVCEALLERVAEWADAGWWVYPNSATICANVMDGDAPPPSRMSVPVLSSTCIKLRPPRSQGGVQRRPSNFLRVRDGSLCTLE